MNSYEARLAARKARLEARAENAMNESNKVYAQAKRMSDAIPFGQPILVGHHSEGRDRNFRERINKTYGKAFALHDKAAYYAKRAASVGTGGISSDDPDAISKLQKELDAGVKHQEMMKAVNRAIRTHSSPTERIAAIVALGITETAAAQLVEPDYCGRVGFPAYALQGNNANMTRIKGRIAQLKENGEREDKEEEGKGYTYREDIAENRIMFIFDGKPVPAVRELLKAAAFRWSPSRGAWVRQLNNRSLWIAKQLRKQLDELTETAEA